jgi:2'-5' RNA ligase
MKETRAGNESWRVFCAVEIPAPARRLLLEHIARLKAAAPDAKASWSREENLHLTLKFLGEVPQTAVERLSNAASHAVADLSTFSIQLEHTGVFPNHGAVRVLWIGINDFSGMLAELQARLEDQAALAGFAKEARRFQPHLTLARLRKPARTLAAAHQQLAFDPQEIAVSELLAIRSELTNAGSKYTVVSRHALERPAGPAFNSHAR